uniref:Predicted nuclease of the RNAse H fold, HicB family n=1 Tax=Candidatus Kentrum sp. TUN TaxID=2126343 RepID=A0A450ZR45_9GAMM|nr:MAG: Predicted nuclease of the RNAse H fold, HicB family [Candidatus Kentron sp. TUN]VFK56299.1 MAG: Predicted nuclease of the RNAse H fold, HicB family [Candidatus Kentron sp. TUN]VFK62390.1 MAG: Predicted nuclease of the RNAse H fold, HicB family [Candidatus Kentron sp. TUN]
MNVRYSVLIRWSDGDQCYVASLSEFGPYAHTHGQTYEEALTNAKEALALLIEDTRPLPEPQTYRAGEPASRFTA